MLPQVTFDTGMLIGLERRKARAVGLLRSARRRGLRITVPAAVVAEWWRGSTKLGQEILNTPGLEIEPLTTSIAKAAGEAIAATKGATVVDAIVMASAALRGDTVYTSDVDDLTRLQHVFPGVVVLGV